MFVVNPKSAVRLIIYYPEEVARSIDEILRAVKALQTADKYGVALPAVSPQNELIEKKVVIPASSDEKTAKAHAKMYENYDWWFCYNELEG